MSIPTSVMMLIAVGSFFNMIGYILCTESSVYGRAGPAQALMEMQSVWQLLLEIGVNSHYPTLGQSVGMAVAFAGSIVVAVDLPN